MVEASSRASAISLNTVDCHALWPPPASAPNHLRPSNRCIRRPFHATTRKTKVVAHCIVKNCGIKPGPPHSPMNSNGCDHPTRRRNRPKSRGSSAHTLMEGIGSVRKRYRRRMGENDCSDSIDFVSKLDVVARALGTGMDGAVTA